MPLSKKLYDAIVDGKPPIAQAIVQEELAVGADPMALIAETMIPAMDEVGKLFQEEEYFVPELMLAGRAMKAAMEPLRPLRGRRLQGGRPRDRRDAAEVRRGDPGASAAHPLSLGPPDGDDDGDEDDDRRHQGGGAAPERQGAGRRRAAEREIRDGNRRRLLRRYRHRRGRSRTPAGGTSELT